MILESLSKSVIIQLIHMHYHLSLATCLFSYLLIFFVFLRFLSDIFCLFIFADKVQLLLMALNFAFAIGLI